MHHSTGNVPCAQHTRPLQQDVVLGCTRKERRTDQDLSWYMRLPPFTENSKARDHLLQEQQAPASPGMCSRVSGKGSAGAKPSLGRLLHLCPKQGGSPEPGGGH